MDNYIVLGKGNRSTNVCVNCKGDFFSSSVIVKLNNDRLTIERATPLYSGKTLKPTYKKSNWYRLYATLDLNDWVGKRCYPDTDESNEEILVFYLND